MASTKMVTDDAWNLQDIRTMHDRNVYEVDVVECRTSKHIYTHLIHFDQYIICIIIIVIVISENHDPYKYLERTADTIPTTYL